MSGFPACPVPGVPDIVVPAHGGGGRMTQRLMDQVILPALGDSGPEGLHDAATFAASGMIAVSTDSFVVTPWRFPGGDIGSLAVHGTVNDLAMAGARALALTAGFVLEEGFPLQSLREVVSSMARAARECGVRIVAGDTKVVERGHGDGVYVNTTGVGLVLEGSSISPSSVQPGDVVLVSGDLGRHGTAVMTSREGLELDSDLSSDSASVSAPALALLDAGLPVRCMRDPTRGGLASVLNEIAATSQVRIRIHEDRVPVRADVAGVCELLGLDPLYVACEGRFSVFVAPEAEEEALRILRSYEVSAGACRIGEVEEGASGVLLRTTLGVDRILDLLSGEQLPRIC